MLLILLLTSSALAQRDATIPDPDPEIERKSFQVAEGFEVNLFAGDPMLAKPIQINFDASGRLWVASSEVYPQIAPGQQANDKILVLEDADGDGKADKTTVFADGLLIPTGVAPGDAGAYVANSTEILHLKDSDGDGKADSRNVLLGGFGTEDTHHIIHTFRWGVDGQLYFNQSTYIHSHVETPWGPRRLGGGGIWMFRPESRRLEIFTRGLINPWGHQVDTWGQSFATDGAGGEGINFMIPGASYAWTPGESRIVAGLNPGSPKYCGLEIVSGRHMPAEMQGILVTNDFRAHRVCRFQLSEDGSGFASKELPELIKTTHPAFRPIDVALGPDGALYIADWYNPIIQHGEVDFRDPRRDHTHGRIWRITAKGRPLLPNSKIQDANIPELLGALESPEGWTRRMAKQVLKERGADAVLFSLREWVRKLDPADPNHEQKRLEALWVLQAIDVPDRGLLNALLDSPEPHVRAAALRVVPFWKDRVGSWPVLDKVIERASDDHPRVRLEAVRALASFSEVKAFEGAMGALDQPMDKFLDYALWLTVRQLEPVWLPELKAGRLALVSDTRKLTFALESVGSTDVVGPLVDALEAGKIAKEQQGETLKLIARLANADELQKTLVWLRGQDKNLYVQGLLDLAAPDHAGPRRQPSGDLSFLLEDLKDEDYNTRHAALMAAVAWRVEPIGSILLKTASDNDASPQDLIDAVYGLQTLSGTSALNAIEALTRNTNPMVRWAATLAIIDLDPTRAREPALSLLGHSHNPDRTKLLFQQFSQRATGPAALAAALQGQSLPADVAKIGLRVARASAQPDERLIDALIKAGGLTANPPPPSPEEMKALVEEVQSKGDPAQGETIFRRAEMQCMKCHAIAGAGGNVGPGLESIGASTQVDYLIDSLLQPTKAVKEGYHSVVIATKDGKIVTGIVLRRDDRQVVLRDVEGAEVAISKENIEEEQPGQSLMPEALVAELPRDEFVHLVRFLAELGKGEFAVGPEQVVRRWEVLPATQEQAESVKRIGYDAVARGEQPKDAAPIVWQPAYSRVNGELPLSDAPPLPDLDASAGRRWIRFGIDVTTPGGVGLEINLPAGVTVWAGGKRVDHAADDKSFVFDLPKGSHMITFAIDPAARNTAAEGLRCRLIERADSPVRARFRLGK
jgi:putative heme-binding domain-containing protein